MKDIRHIVFAVVRHRPIMGQNQVQSKAMGSGFFVSPRVFLTCHHVIDPSAYPLSAGDYIHLVSMLSGGHGFHTIPKLEVGKDLHLSPTMTLP